MNGSQSEALSISSPPSSTEGREYRHIHALELVALAKESKTLSYLSFEDETFSPIAREDRVFADIRFENCRFDDSVFRRVDFIHCHFVDCSFEGATLEECEFSQCLFERVRLYRFRLINTTFDPRMLFDVFDKRTNLKEALNVFHQLARNAKIGYEPNHFRLADSHYRRLERYRIIQDWKNGKIPRFKLAQQYLQNLFHDLAFGYGHSFFRYFLVTFALFLSLILFNMFVWDHLGIVYSGGLKDINPFFISLYFTASIVTTLGFGDITPTTAFGFVLTAIEALMGMLWMSIFVSLVFRRLFR